MAEAGVGLALSLVTLAQLFSTCIECFDYYQASQTFDEDYEILLLKVDLEKERLLIWGNKARILEFGDEERQSLNEKAIHETLKKISELLTAAGVVQETYGLRPSLEAGAPVQEPSRALFSRNSMNIFKTAYKRFRVRNKSVLSGPGAKLRTKWAIHDKNKFEGLIIHLRDFVDKLYQIAPVEREAKDRTVEEDIESIMELADAISKLRLIQMACETSYPIYAGVASTIIEASETGTLDQRSVNESLRDRLWVEKRANEPVPQIQMQSTPLKTHPEGETCTYESFEDYPLDQDDLTYFSGVERDPVGALIARRVKISDFTDISPTEALRMKHRSSGGDLSFPATAKIYICCPPCIRLINSAISMCLRGRYTDLIDFYIRVDDRLVASCCPGSENVERVEKIRDAIVECELYLGNTDRSNCLDRSWLEKRLYEIEEEQPSNTIVPGSHLCHIFNSFNYGSDCAGVVILGEENYVSEIMNKLPMKQKPRMPRATEVYLTEGPNSIHGCRSLLGTYTRNFKMPKEPPPAIPAAQTTPLMPSAAARSRTPPPSVELPAKRQKSSSVAS